MGKKSIKFIIKIKEKYNPPVFNEKEGRGVIATHYYDIPKDVNKDEEERITLETAKKLLNEYFEVTYEEKK